MSSLYIIAKLITANKDARETVLAALKKVTQSTQENEPDVLRYAICLPLDPTDSTSIWVIEGYPSQAVLDTHLATPAVAEITSYFGANATLFGAAPTIVTAETSAAFVRPGVGEASDPFITYASIEYKEGKREEAVEGWKKVAAETEKNEPGTLSYVVAKDKEDARTVKTIEVYASQTYFKEVHVPSPAVQENRVRYGDEIRVSLSHVFLKLVAGYLYKEKAASNL